MSIYIKIKGLDQFKKALQVAPMRMKTELMKAILMSAFEVEGRSKEATPVDSGHLRKSIRTRSRELSATVAPHVDYAIYVHEGTRPHWPPIDAISDWARKHGIEPFLVARAISIKGTKATPFMKIGAEKSARRIELFFNKAIKNVLKSIASKTKI